MHKCKCCGTTQGTAWNDRYCNVCEYWQVSNTQACTYNIKDWPKEEVESFKNWLVSREVQHHINPATKLLHINCKWMQAVHRWSNTVIGIERCVN